MKESRKRYDYYYFRKYKKRIVSLVSMLHGSYFYIFPTIFTTLSEFESLSLRFTFCKLKILFWKIERSEYPESLEPHFQLIFYRNSKFAVSQGGSIITTSSFLASLCQFYQKPSLYARYKRFIHKSVAQIRLISQVLKPASATTGSAGSLFNVLKHKNIKKLNYCFLKNAEI